ncbi:MAG: polysaccharide biosynthesis/export family protein [Bacteroidota bacterium]
MNRALICAVIALLCLARPIAGAEVDKYRLDTGDVIRVSVWGHEDLGVQVTVGPDGRVALPLLGEVSVRGATLSEVEAQTTAKFAEFLREPQVTVVLVARRQISVKVFGQVNRPGAFLVNPDASIAELIAMAGGATKRAALEQVQLMKGGDPARAEILPQGKDDKFGLVSQGGSKPQLADGDVIFVPETRKIDWQFLLGILGGLLTLKQLIS